MINEFVGEPFYDQIFDKAEFRMLVEQLPEDEKELSCLKGIVLKNWDAIAKKKPFYLSEEETNCLIKYLLSNNQYPKEFERHS